jgi:hypothetical protein
MDEIVCTHKRDSLSLFSVLLDIAPGVGGRVFLIKWTRGGGGNSAG